MRCSFRCLGISLVVLCSLLVVELQAQTKLDFNRDIKPILSNTCFQCHGPDANERKGGTDGLRLDTPEGAVIDLGGYVAIKPGDPTASALIKRILSTDPDEQMPPPSTGKKLSPRDIQLLTDWVKQGATYARHWSYVKPVRPALPAVKLATWTRNPIDHFILSRLDHETLQPMPEADRPALIRRLSLDLTGLPPTLAEVDAFVNNADPLAYEKLVDELLKKESYGEYWAHMWLDLARYADSAGYADDPPRTIWAYRDYVIRSLNANKPFDQFTIEQLAGDLLPSPTEEQLIATAFHRNTLTNNEGGTNDEEFRNVAVVDRVNTTMAVWMGTTIACAQCHSHKYDPITQEEYFRFFAFFNNSEDADRREESPLIELYSDEQRQNKTNWQQEIESLERKVTTPTPELAAAQLKWEQSFPRDVAWKTLRPTEVVSQGGAAASVTDDGTVRVAAGAKTDTYTLEMPLEAGPLNAVRLESLPDAALPGKGAGHGSGNFVLSKVSAHITPPNGARLNGRFVRVELFGKGVFLHLAEVQAFSGDENVALKGEATQVSTDYDGPAKLAIDGKTDGNYVAKSVSHTAQADNPWWEVDLKASVPIDRVVLWNRTDGPTHARLNNYRVQLLNENRDVVWEEKSTEPPPMNREFAMSGVRGVAFSVALADYSQSGFDPKFVLEPQKDKGWAVGGSLDQPHALTLIAKVPHDVAAGSKLTIKLEQSSSFENHTLGSFRLSTSSDTRVAELARTPANVLTLLNTVSEQRTDAQRAELQKYFLTIAADLQPDRDQLAKVKKQLADLKPMTSVPIMRDLAEKARRKTQLQHRGNFMDLGQDVSEGTPAVFPALPDGAPRNRLTLARWLMDENNPLTARVIANRYWEQIFGIGIVATSEEFGSQGDQPFHPELLDWLATELVRLKWDMKEFTKLLVTSAAYRQSSRVTPELIQRDPDNRLLARGPRFRLSAETVRDQALAVSGLLSSKLYGPPVKPPQPALGLSAAFGSGVDWQTSAGDDKFRRALYTTWRRSSPYPSMATFDAPNREVCTVRRGRTNTPLQALVTLNDPVYVEAAQSLARRTLTQGGTTTAERAMFVFRTCLSRPPQATEQQRLTTLFEQSLAEFKQHPDLAMKMATDPLGPPPAGTDTAELAAWTVVGNVLLNLDEMLMKR